MAGGDLHPNVQVIGSAVAVEHANGNGRPLDTSEVAARGETTDELRRALNRLERAYEALQRENARLARGAVGQTGSAAAVRLTRAEHRWSEHAKAAERRWREQAEAAELDAERLARLLATPRHRAVERARETLMRSPSLYPLVRRSWAGVANILRLER